MPRGAMNVLARIEAAWFTPMPAARLALLRALVGAYAFVRVSVLFFFVLPRAARGEALVEPVGVMRLLPDAPSVALLGVVVLVAATSGVAFVAGFFYRASGPLFAGSLLTILSYFNSFGMIYHSDQLLVLHTLVLAVAPAADAWSLDARRRARSGELPPPEPHWRYGWPIQLLCALTATVYALAGVAKLAAHGLGWALGDALRARDREGRLAQAAARRRARHPGRMGLAQSVDRHGDRRRDAGDGARRAAVSPARAAYEPSLGRGRVRDALGHLLHHGHHVSLSAHRPHLRAVLRGRAPARRDVPRELASAPPEIS